MLWPSTKCAPRSRIAWRVAVRTAGKPSRPTRLAMIDSGVSCAWMMRADRPSAQAEAETSSDSERTSWWEKSAALSLSSIRRSAVALSGTRSSASASTMRAEPSLVESEYSCRKSSIPPTPPARARIASISAVARASMRVSAAGSRPASARKRAASSSSGAAYGALNAGTCGVSRRDIAPAMGSADISLSRTSDSASGRPAPATWALRGSLATGGAACERAAAPGPALFVPSRRPADALHAAQRRGAVACALRRVGLCCGARPRRGGLVRALARGAQPRPAYPVAVRRW